MNGYIRNFLDNDLYKFTMQNAVCKLYPKSWVRYEFFNRDNRPFPEGFGDELKRIITTFKEIKLTKEEKNYFFQQCYYLDPMYLDFLYGYQYDPEEVFINQFGSDLKIHIEGYWYRTILWEVPLMATISQLYFEKTKQRPHVIAVRRLCNILKSNELSKINIKVADFGTRRRFSSNNHLEVIQDFKNYGNFLTGSSNVDIARQFNLIPVGTQAHEWTQFHAALTGYQMANHTALKKWVEVYRGALGIALPDTFTTKIFLRSFDYLYSKVFDGVRQDSGNPQEFIQKILQHYKKLEIDSNTKTIIFSDNLKSSSQISGIHEACKGNIKDSYGIGTWLTNDVGVKPLNIVIKMTGCSIDNEWIKTIKLSDNIEKNTGDHEEIKFCKQILNIS